MKNKNIILATLVGTAAFSLQSLAQLKMNVLFIMADDLNNNLGCYGHYLVKTPNLDKLASQGMMFNKAYCQLPLSGPSRASMLTGLRPEKTNMCVNETNFRDALPNVVTLPQLFMNNGYVAGRAGKLFHYGVPGEIGTDGHDDTLSWNIRVNPKGRDKWEEDKLINYKPTAHLGGAPAWLAAEGSDLEQTDGMVATEVIKMMAANKNKSFFIGAGFFRPHCPYVAPKKYFDLYPIDSIRLPYNPDDDLKDIPELALNNGSVRKNLTEEQQKNLIRAYYASITFMDAQVGRLIIALDSLGLSENTIIVFMGDNGYHLGEHHLWGKLDLFEEAARVPLIVYNPKVKPSVHQSNLMAELIDVYPMLAYWTGLETPAGLDGMNLADLYEGRTVNWKKSALSVVSRPNGAVDKSKVNWGYSYRGKSIRTERWHYIEWDGGASGAELYDHLNDPREFTNLAGKPEFEKEIAELKKLLK